MDDSLLLSQCLHRVDMRCPSRRRVYGEERDREHDRNNDEQPGDHALARSSRERDAQKIQGGHAGHHVPASGRSVPANQNL